MWQEQLDYFWDGGRRLALGFFDGDDGARENAPHPQLTIVSARDDAFLLGPACIDVIDAMRWRSRIVFIDLPAEHRFVRLTALDGAQLVLELSRAADPPAANDWRLLMLLAPEPGGGDFIGLHVAALSARGDLDQLAREQIAAAGARLVWAIGQRRAVTLTDSGGAQARLLPATQVYPLEQNRLTLEAIPYDFETAADTRDAPFAIMQRWLAENGAPRVVLRLRLAESLEESATLLGRVSVAMALRQRQRLNYWMQAQRQAGEPVIDPLTFEDIRQATGDPTEHPDAVESGEAVVVVNLLNLILDPGATDSAGVAVRRAAVNRAGTAGGEIIEIDFYGAALGDDVGLVSPSAAPGDLGVTPMDPGGSPFVRLLRVEGDGLVPRRVNEDDPLLDEMLRRATGAARATSGAAARVVADRANAQRSRRERFIAALNAMLAKTNTPDRFDTAGKWELFDPLLQTSFAAGAASGSIPGGFVGYVADPALAVALSRAGALSAGGVATPARDSRLALSLLHRMLAALGLAGMATREFAANETDAGTEALFLQKLTTSSPDAAALRDAHVSLPADLARWDETIKAARRLGDASVIDVAQAHFAAHDDPEAAAALADYLAWRQAGNWLPAEDAVVLAGLIARAESESAEARVRAEAAALAQPPEKPKGFFRRLFG
jgi:hypothetical protein